MAESNLSVSDLSVDDWAKEVSALSAKSGAGCIFFDISCPIGFVRASGFQPQVDARRIHIRQSPEGHEENHDDALCVFLPRADSAYFRKYDLGGETIGFSVAGLAGATDIRMELYLATTEAFLEIVTNAAPVSS